ncbi:MAG: hypothetical protein ACJ77N_00130 [Chloroflexota bacterium]
MAHDAQDQHVALPKLYGAPAYARPVALVPETAKPFDPDEMPLEAHQTSQERDWVEQLPAHAYKAGGGVFLGPEPETQTAATAVNRLDGRPFRLRALAGRVLGPR